MPFTHQEEWKKNQAIRMGYGSGSLYPRYTPYIPAYDDGGAYTAKAPAPETVNAQGGAGILPQDLIGMPQYFHTPQRAGSGMGDGWRPGGGASHTHMAGYGNAGTGMLDAGAPPPYMPARFTPPAFTQALIGGNGQVAVAGMADVGLRPTVRLADGKVIPMDRMRFANYGTRAVYETAGEFEDSANANRFLQLFQESGLHAADFLQLYLDVYLEDLKSQEGSQGSISTGSPGQGYALPMKAGAYNPGSRGGQGSGSTIRQDMPFGLAGAAQGGAWPVSGHTQHAIRDLRNGGGLSAQQSVELLSDPVFHLANSSESGIINTPAPTVQDHSARGKGSGAAGEPGGDGVLNLSGAGTNPYRHLGIQDVDYQAYLDGKLTEADLLVLANMTSLHRAAPGVGNWAYMYQNTAYEYAAEIRRKYDPNFADTHDYTYGGKYNKDIIEPMPGPPRYNVLTRLTEYGQDENQNVQASGESDKKKVAEEIPEEPSASAVLLAVLTPEQRKQRDQFSTLMTGMISQEQLQRIEKGTDLSTIIGELDPSQQAEIAAFKDTIIPLSIPQQRDLYYLLSGVLDGFTLAERQVFLRYLNANDGELEPANLRAMAVDAIRDNTAGPLFKIIDQLPAEENGKLVGLIDIVRLPYSSAQFLMSVEEINIETMREQQAEVGMLAYLTLASLGGMAVDRWQYGPSLSPKDQFNPNSRLDSIEWKGWSVKGPQSFMKSPEVVGNPGGQAAGAEEIETKITYKPSSGIMLKANPNKTTTVLGSYDIDMKNVVGELGNVKSTDFGPKKGGFNVLNVPEEMFKTRTRQQFWDDVNKPWLDEAIKRGDDIVLATKPEGTVMRSFNTLTGEWGPSGFAREYQYLYENGYRFDSITNMMVK